MTATITRPAGPEPFSRFSVLLDRCNAPLGFAAGDTNLCRYVGNNVTDEVDPTGLDPYNSYWNANPTPKILPYSANGSWPIAQYAPYSGLSTQQMTYAAQVGCYGLMQMQLNMCPPNPTYASGGMAPYNHPGMTFFGSYSAAQQYQAQQLQADMNATFVAYQFENPGGAWIPPTTGQLTPQQVQTAGPDAGAGNWATLMSNNYSQQLYWQYMNNGTGGASEPATVYHSGYNSGAPNYGLPSGPTAMNTTIYGVYVPVTMPTPPPQANPGPGYWYYFWQMVNPFD